MKPDVEDVIDQVIAIFEAQFPANLAAVDARKSSPMNPIEPQEYIFADTKVTPLMPCLLFSGDATTEDEDNPGWRRQTYKLFVEAYYEAESVEVVSRIVRRYGAAIDDTLRSNTVLSGYWIALDNITQTYWDTMEAQASGGLFQAVKVSFDVLVITN